VVISCLSFEGEDETYRIGARHDELLFVLEGGGSVRTPFGDLPFERGDYVMLPRGLLHRLRVRERESQHYLSLRFSRGVGIPSRFRNPVGQLRMDAPYCHRDFGKPEFRGPVDEGIRTLWVDTGPEGRRFVYEHSPLDVVGWDGCVYPWTFPISRFQPRVSSVHLPPTWHGTFEGPGALVCSFVPRPVEYHPEAVVCPYPHVSAEIDEVLFYVEGNFTSRRGVESGSLTWHPAGLPHGPHPGRYEASARQNAASNATPEVQFTSEMAVMLDCTRPLEATGLARRVEDADYEASFSAG
jgi:homogentisate 1,2-dioxygenase